MAGWQPAHAQLGTGKRSIPISVHAHEVCKELSDHQARSKSSSTLACGEVGKESCR